MTHKKILLLSIAVASLFSLYSCKKDRSISSDIETTFDLTGKQAIADGLVDDANSILDETIETQGLSGSREPLVCMSTTTCATVTVSSGPFPKAITLDFGSSGCSSGASPIVRRGIIRITLSDSLRRPGSTAVMTFENYYVNDYKKEGTITWTNTSTPGVRSWNRIVTDGKITNPYGSIWYHSSNKNVVQVAGINTPRILLDDAFSITGTGTITNPAGNIRNTSIVNALHKAVACEHVDQGTVRVDGGNHYAIIDFGNGNCDALATISIDGYTPRTVTLP